EPPGAVAAAAGVRTRARQRPAALHGAFRPAPSGIGPRRGVHRRVPAAERVAAARGAAGLRRAVRRADRGAGRGAAAGAAGGLPGRLGAGRRPRRAAIPAVAAGRGPRLAGCLGGHGVLRGGDLLAGVPRHRGGAGPGRAARARDRGAAGGGLGRFRGVPPARRVVAGHLRAGLRLRRGGLLRGAVHPAARAARRGSGRAGADGAGVGAERGPRRHPGLRRRRLDLRRPRHRLADGDVLRLGRAVRGAGRDRRARRRGGRGERPAVRALHRPRRARADAALGGRGAGRGYHAAGDGGLGAVRGGGDPRHRRGDRGAVRPGADERAVRPGAALGLGLPLPVGGRDGLGRGGRPGVRGGGGDGLGHGRRLFGGAARGAGRGRRVRLRAGGRGRAGAGRRWRAGRDWSGPWGAGAGRRV
ncbi:MAG: hypothetical protein AVDCRST_MAG04-952, partial [uncultured Acetobacteraceae bacterium]